jgi:phytoene dehydrogenase-like protein
MTERPQVVVVGAGLAGLVAAHRLAGAGLTVTVLEAAEDVGGRVSTETIDGFVIDRGAQFLSTAYSHIPGLVAEVGLQAAWRPTSPSAAIIRDGEPRSIHYRNRFSFATGGLLGAREFLQLGRHFASLRRGAGARSRTTAHGRSSTTATRHRGSPRTPRPPSPTTSTSRYSMASTSSHSRALPRRWRWQWRRSDSTGRRR